MLPPALIEQLHCEQLENSCVLTVCAMCGNERVKMIQQDVVSE